MAKQKEYLRGNAKEHLFNNGSSLINFSVNIKQAAKMAGVPDNIVDQISEDFWLNATITKKRDVDKFGNTHSVYKNDYEKKEDQKDGKAGNKLPF